MDRSKGLNRLKNINFAPSKNAKTAATATTLLLSTTACSLNNIPPEALCYLIPGVPVLLAIISVIIQNSGGGGSSSSGNGGSNTPNTSGKDWY